MLKFTHKGIYCVPGEFYIDPWLPVNRALITHAHADHARGGMSQYLCHDFTAPVLKCRLGDHIVVQSVGYNEPLTINHVHVSLHPAGHIIGSAQIRLEYKGKIVVVSGDYKLQDDGLATPFEPIKCHEFITESTFGLPIYRWTSIEEQNKQLQNWVLQNISSGKTSILFGYSLGKAQRIMSALDGIGPIYVHNAIARLNQAYQSIGIALPDYHPMELSDRTKNIAGQIIILPPALYDSNLVRKIPIKADAICSGWMQVRGARRWRSSDAGFPISDHADWNGLLTAIKATEAEKVYVTHGQTAAFTRYLNDVGVPAEEIQTEFGEQNEQTTDEN